MNNEMTKYFVIGMILACGTAQAAQPYRLVSEPKPSDRRIELKLLHPAAKVNPVRRDRVERMTVGQVRKLMADRKGIWQDATLDCMGGYNPLSSEGYDFLDFSIADHKSERELLIQFANDRPIHDVCMTKAYALAERLNRERR